MDAPTENLVRMWARPEACQMRAADQGDGNTLFGHFAVFNRWTEINSYFEGRFMERVVPGAFKDTFAQRGLGIRVLYEHGHDPQIGNKPIAEPKIFREDEVGAYYEARLFNSTYAQELKEPLEAKQLGASFRFKVTSEEWIDAPKPSDDNPKGLPERSITGVDCMEAGPCTFGAYDEATAGLRSGTDQFFEWLTDPLFAVRFAEHVGPKIVEQMLASLPADGRSLSPLLSADGQRVGTSGPDPRAVLTLAAGLKARG